MPTTSTSGPTIGPRFPLNDLLKLVGNPTYAELADRVGQTRRAVTAAASRGLSSKQADRYATAVGLHPVLVWPTFDDDLHAADTHRLVSA